MPLFTICVFCYLLYAAVDRKPWEHVIGATVTAMAFNWIVQQEEYLVKQIEEHYAGAEKKSS